MIRPSLLVRFTGSPLGALCVFLGCIGIAIGWRVGDVPWWGGMTALVIAWRTFGAVAAMRRYKHWMRQWEAMDNPPQPPEKKRKQPKLKPVPDAEPVSCLLGRASGSPSRADAERNLPDYAAALLNSSKLSSADKACDRR